MEKKNIPFWIEGMKTSERNRCVSNLFDLLEHNLNDTITKMDISINQTFVFVPDPPPLFLKECIQDFEVNNISWGIEGQAVVTNNKQVARILAPIMLDLWSDSLYVILFNGETADEALLKRWITKVIQDELGTVVDKEIEFKKTPKYAFLHFDWGDLVEYPPNTLNQLS
jgi:hypothetical protein